MMYPRSLTFRQAVDRLDDLVAENLHAELVDARLLEERDKEARYVVRWMRRDFAPLRFGTHIALLDLRRLPGMQGDTLLWGHYDMDEETSKLDLRSRT